MRNLIRLLSYIRPHRAWLLLGVGLMVMVGVLQGVVTMLVRPVVQLVLEPDVDRSDVVLLELTQLDRTYYLQDFVPLPVATAALLVVASLVIVFIVKAVGAYLAQYSVHRLGESVVMDMRNGIYAGTVRRSLSFFSRQSTGKLMSTTMNDVARVQLALSHWLADMLRQIFTLPVLLVFVFLIDWRLTLLCFVTVPFVVLPVARIGQRIRWISRQAQEEIGDLNQALHETYSGVRIVQAFGSEKWETERFSDRARRLFDTQLRWVRHYAAISPLMEILGAVTIGALLLYARHRISAGALTPENVMVFVVALTQLYQPVRRLSGMYSMFQQALGAADRVFELLDVQEEVREKPEADALPPFRERIELDRVSFTYQKGAPLLRDISLSVNRGQALALVGSSGVGKTTLVNLLPRFYDVTGGAIRIDGRDIREVTLSSLRSQIGIVTQETILFNDTARNNICYGKPHATEDEVRRAAQAALAHDFIEGLPQGYETLIGERGVRLSGGQRQRLAIARALLKDAPILILDEATSELDAESELLVQQALGNLMQGRTVFVIAHRLSTIRRADTIVVLEEGSIREVGKHQELLARGGLYQRLYDLQFVDLDAPPAMGSQEPV